MALNGRKYGSIFSLSLAVVACGTPGARPHDMSIERHEREASAHEQQASQHEAMYDPSAQAERIQCTGAPSRFPIFTCWRSLTNPTEEHLREAERHRRIAAEHRAASQALRDAEARSCAGLPEGDRDMSPFAHREDIVAVAPLDDQLGSDAHGAGVLVTFRAVPGMTAEWLQRLVDCHLARADALGHQATGMEYCPLMPNGVTARVSTISDGFVVAIRAVGATTVAEIRRRASTLLAR